ncbi:hypothetical protein NM208_g5773 [Fusarium decemcellulare]|uniref:Uncharacterized protein n=1 Tax=Fusarium decemcellulare TaxID=57161 RepID=A0ACC1SFK8_9HYPO|nr:hypothetical protein NM208_g5773 [Fusarium decemcellulare]
MQQRTSQLHPRQNSGLQPVYDESFSTHLVPITSPHIVSSCRKLHPERYYVCLPPFQAAIWVMDLKRLCDQLGNASQVGALTGGHRKFIPETRLKEMITVAKIKEELKMEFRFWNRWSDGSLAIKTHKQAPKVFAILSLIGFIKCIKDLHAEGLTDEHLPLSHKGPTGLVLTSSSKIRKDFHTFARYAGSARLFLEKQWEVLAPQLSVSGNHIVLDDSCALPITITGPRNTRGGASSVVKGTIHEGHFSGFEIKHKSDLDIAIKELMSTDEHSAEEVFEKERLNLKDINKIILHQHLLRTIATCMVCDKYYILFPWAEGGDLNDFWKRRRNGPGDANLVLWSLKQMMGLVDALRLMHEINHRHGDLKPGNILHFPRGNPFCHSEGLQETLVIADYGVAKRHEDATHMRQDGTNTKATTRAYEAPEAEGPQNDPRSRRYDLWSVGCIFLEFAVWLLYGHDAVRGFASQRMVKGKMNGGHPCFYATEDNEEQSRAELNEAVNDAVDAIRNDPRCTESTAIGDLVDLIPRYLLLIDAEERDTAQRFHERLTSIVSKAEGQSSYLFREVSSPPGIPSAFRYSGKSEGKKLPTIDDMQS